MILYLSGPISGVENYAEPFRRAEEALRAKGWTVLNPANTPFGLRSQADYMRISLAQIEAADAVAFLGGFALSLGACTEALFAAKIGRRLYLASEHPFDGFTIGEISEYWLRDVVASGLVLAPRGETGGQIAEGRPMTAPTEAGGGPGDCCGMIPMDIEGFGPETGGGADE